MVKLKTKQVCFVHDLSPEFILHKVREYSLALNKGIAVEIIIVSKVGNILYSQ